MPSTDLSIVLELESSLACARALCMYKTNVEPAQICMCLVNFLKYTRVYFADLGVGISVVDTVDGLHATTNTCPVCHQSTVNLSIHIPAMSDVVQSIRQLVGEHPPQPEPGASHMKL